MKITEFSPQEFEKLEEQWKILEKGIEMTWFQTYEWYKIVNSHFIAEKKKAPFRFGTYVLLSDDNEKPLMIAPIQIVKKGFYVKGIGLMKGFYFIGRQGYSDYLNFIYDEFKNEYLQEIFTFLVSKYGFNYFRLENISSKCSSYMALNDKSYGADRTDSLCMELPLENTFEDYKSTLSKSMRQNIRTANNRSERDSLTFSYKIYDKIDMETAKKLDSIRNQRLEQKESNRRSSMSLKAKLYTSGRDIVANSTSSIIDVMKENENCWCLTASAETTLPHSFIRSINPKTKRFIFFLQALTKNMSGISPESHSLSALSKTKYLTESPMSKQLT